MPDRLVDLQAQLRTVEDDVEHALGTFIGCQQRDRFFAHPAGVFHQLQFFDQFVSFVLPLSAVRIGIRPLLNFASRKSVGRVAGPGGVFRLMNVRAFGGEEPLLFAAEIQVGFGQRDAGNGTQFGVDFQQQLDVLLPTEVVKGSIWIGRSPLGSNRLFRGHLNVVLVLPAKTLWRFLPRARP